MELIFIPNLPREDFDRFAAAHASGSFLQSSDWGDWMEANGKQAARVAVASPDGSMLLAAQIFTTPMPIVGGTYLYVPYGPLAVNSSRELMNFFLAGARKQFRRNLFLRLEPKQDLPLAGKPTKHIQPGRTLVLDLKKPETELLADMHHKTRYNIKVAKRHGVEIKTDQKRGALELIEETSRRHNFKSHPLSYYEKMVEFFGGTSRKISSKVYSAYYNEELLASAVMLDFAGTRTYLFGGTSGEHRKVMAAHLLHWQAILDAKELGLKTYDFWGIETADGATPGFVRFKLGWGGSAVNYPAPADIVYGPLWYNAYKFLRSLNRLFS